MRLLVALGAVWLAVVVVLPLWRLVLRSVQDAEESFVGLRNYAVYFSQPGLSESLTNSLVAATVSTVLALVLGFGYAYALVRTAMPGRAVLAAGIMLPLYTPSLAHAIGLIYLFGNKGLITTGFFGRAPWPAVDIKLYGMFGIVAGELLYILPQAVLILSVSLALADARLYEAAVALGASRWRTFLTVTLPGVRYGLISAAFVCFTLAITDFGVPKVVGGNTNVLATDIYKQVIGQQNFAMGATVSVLLLVPTAIAFVIDRLAQRRQVTMFSGQAVALAPARDRLASAVALAYCTLVCGAVLAVLAAMAYASVVDVWPYRLSPSLRHYDFGAVGGGGYGAFANSLRMAAYSAVSGTLIVIGTAYLVEKGRGLAGLRRAIHLLAMMPVALPGLVLGLAYIFFFNDPWLEVPLLGRQVANPLHGLYGSMAILVISNIVHFFTVSYLTAVTALKQVDPAFEAVGSSLGVPFWRTFSRVSAPIILPAVLEIAAYFFVSSMMTVSAVIFLYAPHLRLASVAVVNMDDAGDTAAAAAMCTLILIACIGVRAVFALATRGVLRRSQAWRAPAPT